MIYSGLRKQSTRCERAWTARMGPPLALALWLAAWPLPGAAQADRERPLVLDAARLWDFAESLERQGEHYRAVTEYKRLIFFFPDDPRAQTAQFRIAQAYLRGGEPARALAHLSGLAERDALPDRRDALRYWLALSNLERDRARPYPLRLEGIEAALRELEAISPEAPGQPRVAAFVKALRDPPELPEKSPLLAGTLSALVPGTGSFYVGRFAEGSLALFINAVLIYATVNSFQRDQVAAGTVFGALALTFYGGAIYAAINGAHKFNDRARAAYLEGQRVRFGLVVPPAGGIGAAFERDF
jgi:tetratricopeptide (TPR) repeat protein